jgi:membrane fusion protein, multidrug efflux system
MPGAAPATRTQPPSPSITVIATAFEDRTMPNTDPKFRFRAGGLAITGGLLVVMAAAGVFYAQSPAGAAAPAQAAPQAMPVTVATVLQRSITEWDEFSGRLEASERVDVRSRVSGYVEAVHFAPGSVVAKGATLFTIDAKPFAAEVSRAEAVLASAQARVALTTSELARAQRLLDEQAIAQREFDERQNALRDAQASLQSAQAMLELARLNLGYTRITAPISGRVGRAEVTVGNLVAAGAGGATLTSIVSISPIYATFEADEQTFLKYAAQARRPAAERGQVAVPIHMGLANESGHPHSGRIESVDNALDPTSGTIRVRALFDNREGTLTPGLFARLKVGGAGVRTAVQIDDRAVGTDQSKKFVFVVGADQRVAYREVKLGPLVDGLRVVRAGLQPGESIVVNGVQRLRPGMPVAPTQAPMDARAGSPGAQPDAQVKLSRS